MPNYEEAVDCMARVIYTRLYADGLTTTVHPWDELSEKTRHEFTRTVAIGHQAYWDQREVLENRSR